MAASVDGCATLLPAQRLTQDGTCPGRELNGASVDSWPDGGDYYGMATDADGRFHPVWTDARTGAFRLRHAVVQLQR